MNDTAPVVLPLFEPDPHPTLNKISYQRGDRPDSIYVGVFFKSKGYSVIRRDAVLIFTLCELVADRNVESFVVDRHSVNEIMRANELPREAADLVITYSSGLTQWWKVFREKSSSVRAELHDRCVARAKSIGVTYRVRWLDELQFWEIKFDNWLRLNRAISATRQLSSWADHMAELDAELRVQERLTIDELLARRPDVDRGAGLGAIARLLHRGHALADLETRVISSGTVLRTAAEDKPDVLQLLRERVASELASLPAPSDAGTLGTENSRNRRGRPGRPPTVANDRVPAFAIWPEPDASMLRDERLLDQYEARKNAVILFARNESAEEIWSQTGISKDRAREFYKRCLSTKDGRMRGFYALIPYSRTKKYERKTAVKPLKSLKTKGTAGAFQQLLLEVPGSEAFLESFVVPRDDEPPRTFDSVMEIHGAFLEWLENHSRTRGQYPFVRHSVAYQSVRRYIRALQREHGVDLPGGKKPKYGPTTGTGHHRLINPRGPASFLQLDYQDVPAACILIVSNDFGEEFELPIQRFSIAYLACEYSHAILGVGLEFEVEASADSALEAIHSAISPDDDWLFEGNLKFTEHGKFLLRHFVPELTWQSFLMLRVDNALANKAHDFVVNVVDTVGCVVHYGQSHGYWIRDVIERTIGQMEAHGLVRLPSSYGSGLDDPRRDNPEVKAVESRIRLADMMSVLYGGVEAHNLRSSRANQMSCPVVAVKAANTNPGLGFFSQPIPKETRLVYRLLSHIEDRTIAGNERDGVYIQVDHVKYQNTEIARNFDLVGREVRIFVSRRDSRFARAYVKGAGTDLGLLEGRGGWCKVPISWRHRKLLQKAGAAPRAWGNDPVRKWRDQMASKIADSQRAGKKGGGAQALLLAQLLQNEARHQGANLGFDTSAQPPVKDEQPSAPPVSPGSAHPHPEEGGDASMSADGADSAKVDEVANVKAKAAPTKGTATRHRNKNGNAGRVAPVEADHPAGSETDSSITPAPAEQSHQQTRTSKRRADEDIPVSPTPAIPATNVSARAAAPASQVPIPGASFGLNRVPRGR